MTELMSKTDKQYYLRRLAQLEIERSSFFSHWQELSENIDPRRGQFFISNRNKGEKRHGKIINSRATQALRNAQSGMFAGTTSPTRPWFKLETLNQKLMSGSAIKDWCYIGETVLRSIFLDSNFYNAVPVTLGEGIQFATGVMSEVDDFEHVVRFYNHTVGSYFLGQNEKCEIDTFVTRRQRTVKQIVDEFGIENVSPAIKSQYDLNNYESGYEICQFIDPNPNYNPTKADDERYMAFRSAWFELGGLSTNGLSNQASNSVFTDEKFLRKKGFKQFPVHVFRWATTSDDVYGTNCPGMVALGDAKALQIMEKRKAQATDKLINPPLKGPPTLTDVPISSLPGGVTLYDQTGDKEGLTPLYQFEPRVMEMRDDIIKVEQRINEAFFVDLFLAISNMEGIQPKNQLELSQRNAERLLMLGPPLEKLQQDFLAKIVEHTFMKALDAEIIPPPPPELAGQALSINFSSSLAQAQRASEVGAIERMATFVGSLAAVKPTALDKFDEDEAIDKYGQYIGVVPSVIISTEEASKVREARAQQQQQMMQAELEKTKVSTAREGVDAADVLANIGSKNAK